MRIAKITMDGYSNYGNVLQSYALQEVLKKYADTVDTIWHYDTRFLPGIDRWGWKEIVKSIIDWKGFRSRFLLGHDISWESARRAGIRKFSKKHIRIRFPQKPLTDLDKEYDFFVTGSDQVWNPWFTPTRCRDEFLAFASPEKRIAYAASIGIEEIPAEDKSNFTTWLNQMEHISVREQTGATIIKNLTGKTVPVHVDPTLLLSVDEWKRLEERPWWCPETPYICTYFLGEKPKAINKIAKQMGNLPVVDIFSKDNFDMYLTTPEEFLYLIHHAKIIYTDSFHGTVFSILFHCPFIVCDRIDSNLKNVKMNSRINTLLGMISLQSRYMSAEQSMKILDLEDINFSQIDTVLERERQRSYSYLDHAFGGK